MTDRVRLARAFNRVHKTTLLEQTIKLVGEESGEVGEAVLGADGRLLFKDGFDADDVADELADLVATAHYVADHVDVTDLDDRVDDRLEANLERRDRELDPPGWIDADPVGRGVRFHASLEYDGREHGTACGLDVTEWGTWQEDRPEAIAICRPCRVALGEVAP